MSKYKKILFALISIKGLFEIKGCPKSQYPASVRVLATFKTLLVVDPTFYFPPTDISWSLRYDPTIMHCLVTATNAPPPVFDKATVLISPSSAYLLTIYF